MPSMGERIKMVRKERGLTQERLAKLAGLSQATIGDLERGKSHGSTKGAALDAALGVSSLWLTEGKGPRYGSAPIRPVEPQRQINTKLMIACCRAVSAYRQQYKETLDEDDGVILACRLYEQHLGAPDSTPEEILGYLGQMTRLLSDL